jgi:N-acetylmuramoyl-L-alanine amidase CwlA
MSKPYYNKLIAGFRFDYARKAKSISYGGIRKRKTIKAVALHWTEGSSDTCFNECDYFATGNDRSAGAHIFIDRQGHVGYSIPLTRIAWSVMSRGYDDGSYSGILDNTNTVSIELCSCKDPVTGKALPMNAEQEGKLYEVLRWIKLRCKNCDSFVRHYDIRKKPCPAYYVENTEEWNHLKKYVETLIFKKGA